MDLTYTTGERKQEEVNLFCNSKYNTSIGKLSFIGKRMVPTMYKVIEHGIVITDATGWRKYENNQNAFVKKASRTKTSIAKGKANNGTYEAKLACGKNEPEKIASIVSGVAEGCRQSNAALIGGETAEMPGFYPVDEYDLAGFAVGVVDRKNMITGKSIKEGDVLVGIASSGIHSNGYSLVRKVFPMKKENLAVSYESLGGKTLGETLLTPTIIYVKALRSVKEGGVTIKGCSHITGGGFYENIPRMLHDGVRAQIKADSYEIPPIFDMLAKDGDIAKEMMYNTYNMGIGMMLAVDAADADKTVELVNKSGQKVFIVGEIIKGEKGVTLV